MHLKSFKASTCGVTGKDGGFEHHLHIRLFSILLSSILSHEDQEAPCLQVTKDRKCDPESGRVRKDEPSDGDGIPSAPGVYEEHTCGWKHERQKLQEIHP